MTREIKFRAWNKIYKQLGHVVYLDWEKTWQGGGYVMAIYNDIERGSALIDVELMQFTGLKDKNGVEIYENYFVKYTNTNRGPDKNGAYGPWNWTVDIKEVVFANSGFNVFKGFEEPYEVVGNIWQNPELLITSSV